MTFAGDKITVVMSKDRTKTGTFKLDAAKKPREITITPSDGDKPLQGIYELDGDNLKLALSEPGGDRPKEFASKEGTRNAYFVLKRRSPEAAPAIPVGRMGNPSGQPGTDYPSVRQE